MHSYVASQWNGNIVRYDGQTGDFIDEFVHSGIGGLKNPAGLTFVP